MSVQAREEMGTGPALGSVTDKIRNGVIKETEGSVRLKALKRGNGRKKNGRDAGDTVMYTGEEEKLWAAPGSQWEERRLPSGILALASPSDIET